MPTAVLDPHDAVTLAVCRVMARRKARNTGKAATPVDLAVRAGWPPDPWQDRFLRSTTPRVLLNCSRQVGKSTMTSVLALHTAFTEPGSLTLLLSPGLRQSGELFRKVMSVYRATGRMVPSKYETALGLTLESDSRIVSLPGREETIRGYSSVRLLVIDEAARVPDDLYYSVRPMLAVSGGRLLALSSPFGTRGWFYEAWRSEEGWERYEIPATECPRISADFLDEERRNLGEFWFEQEYMCRFLDAVGSAFRREDIDQTFVERVETWDLL